MPDVSIKVMSMNPKREYSIEVKGLDQEQLPDYVAKTYRDLIDLLGAEQIDIKVDNDSKAQLLVEQDAINKRIKEHCSDVKSRMVNLEDEYQDNIGGKIKTDLKTFYKP